MKRFAALFTALDETTRTGEKVEALAAYLEAAPAIDAAWAVQLLRGERPKRLVAGRKLLAWAGEVAALPGWLVEECYQAVGDLAETVALLLPPGEGGGERSLAHWVEQRLLPLAGRDESAQQRAVVTAWRELDTREILVWTKLATGGFRVGVSQRLVVRALARASGVDEPTLTHRLMGGWTPSEESWAMLISPEAGDADTARPYPFYLAYPLEDDPATLGTVDDWQLEWKWDGIRAQVVRRDGEVHLWSRGEELVTARYPEVAEAAARLPDGTVVDGELLPWRDGGPLPFAELQRRIGRKKVGPKLLAEVPVVLIAYDLLEAGGQDLRPRPLAERRGALEALLAERPEAAALHLSPVVDAGSWADAAAARDAARERHAEGLMIKRRAAPYGVGRRRGDWWKWKLDPFAVDAVLLYAQRGHGRRASLYTDYTFGLWHEGTLVPFAKAYSGLTDAEIRRVDHFVRRHTRERFGPVRAVEPRLVFEIAFEGIRRSKRHKSGVAVRFPRMARWREDKKPEEADALEAVARLLPDP